MKKTSVLVTILVVVVNAEVEVVSNQGNNRSPIATKNINQLPISPKQEVYYQPMQLQQQYQQLQPAQQYIPVQFVQAAPLYHNQQQQHQPAMIIIAQPAVVPQPHQMLYPSATQQLLNYFNVNPQAKYQLLQNYQQQQQQQQQQQYVAQAQATNAHPALTYQIMPQSQPQYQLGPVTQLNHAQPLPHPPTDSVQPQQVSLPAFQTPYQLPNFSNSGIFGPLTGLAGISTLAQLTAQKYLPPFRSPAPIITGLENFTPEQQAQIKAQLSSGGPITPLQSNALATGNLQPAKTQQPQTAQNTGPQEFNPSEEDKSTTPGQVQNTNTHYNSGVIYRNQFTKG